MAVLWTIVPVLQGMQPVLSGMQPVLPGINTNTCYAAQLDVGAHAHDRNLRAVLVMLEVAFH